MSGSNLKRTLNSISSSKTAKYDASTCVLIVPDSNNFRHSEGNSAAHIKASLFGSSVQVILRNGALWLGSWQGIYFCEFDGPRDRKVFLAFAGS